MNENKSNFDMSQLTMDDLHHLAKMVESEITLRKRAKREDLINNFITAFNALRDGCPGIGLDVEFVCPECGDDTEVNLFNWVKSPLPDDFYGGW